MPLCDVDGDIKSDVDGDVLWRCLVALPGGDV